jgi:hypothetical protein
MEDQINKLNNIMSYDKKLKQINILQKELINEKNKLDYIKELFYNIKFNIDDDNKYNDYNIEKLNRTFMDEEKLIEKIYIYKVMAYKIKVLQNKLFNKLFNK